MSDLPTRQLHACCLLSVRWPALAAVTLAALYAGTAFAQANFSLMPPMLTNARAAAAAADHTPQWEYWTTEWDTLGKTMKDPTDGCKQSTVATVAGKLGWELLQVVQDSRPTYPLRGVLDLRVAGPVRVHSAPGQHGGTDSTGTLFLESAKDAAGRVQSVLAFSPSAVPKMYAVFKRQSIGNPVQAAQCQ